MSVEVDEEGGAIGRRGEVSGVVVHVLISLAHEHSGEGGVARALALAGEGRSFTTLGDVGVWSSLEETVALFNAVALVIGDPAIGLHVGEQLLETQDGSGFVDRLHGLDGPEDACKHIQPIIRHYDAACEAVALEVASDHALVRVRPVTTERRHAHLCEMTRGLLSRLPVLFGGSPALVTEAECAARGGRNCLYALTWEEPAPGGSPSSPPERDDQTDLAWDGDLEPDSEREDAEDDAEAEYDDGVEGPDQGMEGPDQPVVGTTDWFTGLLADLSSAETDRVLSRIATEAGELIRSDRFLLVLRARPEEPFQLSYRNLAQREAQILARELWDEDPGQDDGSFRIVDIATPNCWYGRLIELLGPSGNGKPVGRNGTLEVFARRCAAALDLLTVVTDVRPEPEGVETELTWYDPWTGLPNRRLFRERVEGELARSRRAGDAACLFLIDLDGVTSLEEDEGGAAGVDLIRQAAERLVDSVRRQDTVARVGHNELAVLLPGLSEQLAIDQLALRSMDAISKPFVILGKEVVTRASIGIAVAPANGDDVDTMIRQAENAKDRAKRIGPNRFATYPHHELPVSS
jgi:diguanylate cyclase (GGDEF)-like protein